MNPRRRKAIARAIVSGMNRRDLNVASFKDFLKKENITVTVEINDDKIVEEEVLVEEAIEEETIEEEVLVEEIVEVSPPAALKVLHSMKNTKTELLAAAKSLGIETKSNMNKKTILDLIESVS